MNALTLDGSPVNSNIGRANTETFTREDLDRAFQQGLTIGQDQGIEIAQQQKAHAQGAEAYKLRIDLYSAKQAVKLLRDNLKLAIDVIDTRVDMGEQMRQTIEQAILKAEGIING